MKVAVCFRVVQLLAVVYVFWVPMFRLHAAAVMCECCPTVTVPGWQGRVGPVSVPGFVRLQRMGGCGCGARCGGISGGSRGKGGLVPAEVGG